MNLISNAVTSNCIRIITPITDCSTEQVKMRVVLI